ncbi:MAG: leucine-rich repeat domain-containing protein [Lachnospiraceae bacterium]|nr:leucine-rich repeat domain-containing protein [Lachnospiraceae bacterium]
MKTTMRNTLTVLLLVLFALALSLPGKAYAAGGIAVSSTNFPDTIFREYVSNYCDTNGNGSLSQTEIADVVSIDVSNMSIGSLKGIAYFTAMTDLDCTGNALTSLDVSKCTSLKYLDCSYNQLTSLTVKGLSELVYLYCVDNELTSLNLSGCSKLEQLFCEENQLSSLNASYCPALWNLDCSDNGMTTLNISGCTELEALYCADNQLTSLNVSGFSVLEYLQCYSNKITSLDLSGSPILKQLCCDKNRLTGLDLSSCPELKYLACSENKLTSLKLSGCTALELLYCDNNKLTSLNVSGFKALQGVYCYNNSLKTLKISDCTALNSVFCYVNNLTSLNLTGCPRLIITYYAGQHIDFDDMQEWTYYPADEGGYYCISCDDTVTVNPGETPVIATHPKSKNAVAGNTAKFTVTAYGAGLKYQWQWRKNSSDSWKNCTSATAGYNTATLKVSATTARHGYQYRCKVTASSGKSVYSKVATLNVLGIKTQPKSVSTTAGKTVTFKVEATGKGKTYQWQYRTSSSDSWKNCTSATTGYNTATLKVAAKTYRNGYQYRCVVKDSASHSVTSNTVTLKVLGIKTQPSSASVAAGKTATFKVAATNAKTYQWQFRTSSSDSWKNCTSATTGYNTATLKVAAKTYRNGYQYRCVVKDSAGNTVYSKAATLTVK